MGGKDYTLPIMRALRLSGITVLLALAGAAVAHAQIIRVAGTIRDEAGRPIRGAIIVAENPDQAPPRLSTTSNDKGQFGFIGIRRGLWTFSIEAPGFETVRFRRQIAAGRQEPVDVQLSRTATPVALSLDAVKGAEIQERIDRAEAMSSSGDLDGAIAVWREVLSKIPALTLVHLRIGELYEKKPDPERALAAYRQLLQIEPGNDKARAAVERLAK
jgi:tetratricopeptide (TPR) repeat protein